jgi:hypothetical protein
LPGATLPVARSLCVHFTTLDGATLSASATFRTLSPAAIRATARSRKSIDRGLTIAVGLQPVQQLESETRRFGNLEASVRSPRRAIDVFRGRDLIEAGLNEAAAGFARQGLWKLYFYGLADVVAWRGGERRLVV